MSSVSHNSNDRDARLEQAIADYLRRIESGQAVDREMFAAQHPDLADELRSFFANRAALERIAEPMRMWGLNRRSNWEVTLDSQRRRNGRREASTRRKSDTSATTNCSKNSVVAGWALSIKRGKTTLNRLVALKMILSGQLASTEDVQRFKQEAEAAANLDHPHIAPIYETGEHDGKHYFSMKLIEGRSLREALPDLRGDLRTGVKLLSQIARAVHHAHQRGVLHRDLKPANVLLATSERQFADPNTVNSDRSGDSHSAFVEMTPYVTDLVLRSESKAAATLPEPVRSSYAKLHGPRASRGGESADHGRRCLQSGRHAL